MTDELPPRAKLLYLLQALEALHGFEHKDEDDQAQAGFEERREAALDEIKHLCQPETAKFVKKMWLKRRPDSLARRLQQLLAALPEAVSNELRRLDLTSLSVHFSERDIESLEEQLQSLRNDLSHGRTYRAEELAPWAAAVEIVCQASLLRLLGFDDESIADAISGSAQT